MSGRWVVVLGIGFALSAAGFAVLEHRDREARQDALERRVDDVDDRVERAFATPLEFFHATRTFVESSDELTSASFSRFAAPGAQRNPTLTAIEWLPLVRGSELGEFERTEQRALAQPTFRVWEPTASGDRAPVGARELYYPLLYAEPPPGSVVGLDIGFESGRRDSIRSAIDSGLPKASPRIRLAEDAEGVYSVYVVAPVFRSGLPQSSAAERNSAVRGLLVALFRLDPVLGASLRSANLAGLGVRLDDVTDRGAEALLYRTGDESASALSSTRTLMFQERRWRLTVSASSTAIPASRASWAFALFGVMLTSLVAIFLRWRSAERRSAAARSAVEQLGQYQLVRKIASGGMGTVYEARHAILRRATAVKVVNPGHDAARLARFEREARAMSVLRHPNTAVLFDYGPSRDGTFYYAMEYVDGVDLEALVAASGPLPAARVVHLLRQIASSLAEAHSRGLIHRDIKPGNVMLTHVGPTWDLVKVLDFGLVKDVDSAEKVSVVGQAVGTAQYMAPEAITEPERVTPAADVYAIGALAYFLLTGDDAFSGRSRKEIFARHIATVVEPPSASAPWPVPRELDALVLHCLEKNPIARLPSAVELREALLRLEVGEWTDDDARAAWTQGSTKLPTTASEGVRESLRMDLRGRVRQPPST